MSEYLKIAIKAAKQAGNYLLENRGTISSHSVDEKARNDFVTYVDRNSEKIIIDTLLENFPDHKILAEEGTQADESTDFRWLIDPLDGTKNYIEDLPIFAVSIALQRGNEIICGVVNDVVHNEIFSAEKGNGAYCNDKQIRVEGKSLSEALIATGFPFRAKQNLPSYLLTFEEIFLNCSGMRRCGSAAIDLAYTAMGRFQGFWELGLSAWDVAAGGLIIQEAGGKISDFNGGDRFLDTGNVIAGTSQVHQKLIEIIQNYFPNKT